MSSVPMNQQERTVWWGSCQLPDMDNPEESCTWESTPSLSYDYAEKARQNHKNEHKLREMDDPAKAARLAFFTTWRGAYGDVNEIPLWQDVPEPERDGWRAATQELRAWFRKNP